MARSRFTEASLTPEERLDLIADILLRGLERLLAARTREKTRRWRERRVAEERHPDLDEPCEKRPDENDVQIREGRAEG